MVAQQIAARGITDQRVLDAMSTIPRHLFVEAGLQSHAYSDASLPIGEKQTISQPYMVAVMTAALELKGMNVSWKSERDPVIRQRSYPGWLNGLFG